MVEQAHEVVDMLLGYPASPTQKFVLLGLGLLVIYLFFERMSRTMDMRQTDPAKALVVVVLGGMVIVFSIVLAGNHLLPHVDERFQKMVLFLSPIVGSLVVTIPTMCIFQKANYLSASISWFVSVIVTGVLLVLIGVGFDAATTGKVGFNTTKERTQEYQKFLDDQ